SNWRVTVCPLVYQERTWWLGARRSPQQKLQVGSLPVFCLQKQGCSGPVLACRAKQSTIGTSARDFQTKADGLNHDRGGSPRLHRAPAAACPRLASGLPARVAVAGCPGGLRPL